MRHSNPPIAERHPDRMRAMRASAMRPVEAGSRATSAHGVAPTSVRASAAWICRARNARHTAASRLGFRAFTLKPMSGRGVGIGCDHQALLEVCRHVTTR